TSSRPTSRPASPTGIRAGADRGSHRIGPPQPVDEIGLGGSLALRDQFPDWPEVTSMMSPGPGRPRILRLLANSGSPTLRQPPQARQGGTLVGESATDGSSALPG